MTPPEVTSICFLFRSFSRIIFKRYLASCLRVYIERLLSHGVPLRGFNLASDSCRTAILQSYRNEKLKGITFLGRRWLPTSFEGDFESVLYRCLRSNRFRETSEQRNVEQKLRDVWKTTTVHFENILAVLRAFAILKK